MFGKGMCCIDCDHYGGRLSDGCLLCMKRGPQHDITFCKEFKKSIFRDDTEEENVFASYSCLVCDFYREKEIASMGECMKFPGKNYYGGKRNVCRFFSQRTYINM